MKQSKNEEEIDVKEEMVEAGGKKDLVNEEEIKEEKEKIDEEEGGKKELINEETQEDKDKNDRTTSINFKLQDIKQSRYAISQFCTRQLQREHIRFKQSYVSEFPNDFICHILINYLSYAREHFKERLEKNVLDLMSTNQSDNTLAEKAFTKGILSMTNEIVNIT